MRAKMDLSGMQKHKNPEMRALQKNDEKKNRKKSQNRPLWGGSVNSLFSRKSDNGSQNHPNGLPDSKMTAQASKNTLKVISRSVKKDRRNHLLGSRNQDNARQQAGRNGMINKFESQYQISYRSSAQVKCSPGILMHVTVEHLASKNRPLCFSTTVSL